MVIINEPLWGCVCFVCNGQLTVHHPSYLYHFPGVLNIFHLCVQYYRCLIILTCLTTVLLILLSLQSLLVPMATSSSSSKSSGQQKHLLIRDTCTDPCRQTPANDLYLGRLLFCAKHVFYLVCFSSPLVYVVNCSTRFHICTFNEVSICGFVSNYS